MSIMALDLGTYTGWAIKDSSGIRSGTKSFKTKREQGAGMRYLMFRRWLDSVKDGVTEIHFEEVRRHAGTQAAHVYGAFQGALMAWCEENNIPYESVPVGVIKKSATGRGNASKQEMIDAAKALGFEPGTHDEADAIHILRHVIGSY